ncbi:MAG TPA: hypothetical protein VKS79_22270 [Gemmataceae bacterium]|nr:hypothetical protein [Gemmataceae bacterium]
MPKIATAEIGCRLVGEYVDETSLKGKPARVCTEVVRSKVVADYIDAGELRAGRIIA